MTLIREYPLRKVQVNMTANGCRWGWAMLILGVGLTGCSTAINPFVDDTTPASEITTPSEQELRMTEVPSAVRRRDWPETRIAAQSGAVTHWPLWMEDSFEDKGSVDGEFRWTKEDYFAVAWSPFRWLVNLGMMPITAIAVRPDTVMVSDGIVGRHHDAARLHDAEAADTTDAKDSDDE